MESGWGDIVIRRGHNHVTLTAVADAVHRCTILHSFVDYLIQVILGVLAFSTLIAKWRLESVEGEPGQKQARRPLRVFVLDTTKQCCGFFLAHIGNMVVASLLAANDVSPCVWYFVNILFDTTVRVLFAYLLLRLTEYIIRECRLDPKGILDFGDYGDLYVLTCSSMHRWLMQLLLWMGIVLMTVVLKGLLVWVLEKPLASMGTWVLGPLERHTRDNGHELELVVVMMIVPFLLCAMQLWVQDSFLRSRKRGKGLHRFDPSEMMSVSRNLRQSQPEPEPLFLPVDALWGPDSHRRRVQGADPAVELETVPSATVDGHDRV